MQSLLCHLNPPDKFTVAHTQSYPQFRGTGPGIDSSYFIQPYLQVASDLQMLTEDERVQHLADWGRICSLNEPTMILTRMLIEPDDGNILHAPFLGRPDFQFPEEGNSYPDCPLLFFENVPFFAVSGYVRSGTSPDSISYLRHALENGRWRKQSFQPIDEHHLSHVAERLIARYATSDINHDSLQRWVRSQIGPPSSVNGHPSSRHYKNHSDS
jgi:hypothetical protein